MSTFQLTIITAKGKAFEGAAEAVMLNGVHGSFGILANHAPLIGALAQGLAKVTSADGKEHHFMLGQGYVDCARNEVSVLVGQSARIKDRITGLDLLKKKNPWQAAEELEHA